MAIQSKRLTTKGTKHQLLYIILKSDKKEIIL